MVLPLCLLPLVVIHLSYPLVWKLKKTLQTPYIKIAYCFEIVFMRTFFTQITCSNEEDYFLSPAIYFPPIIT